MRFFCLAASDASMNSSSKIATTASTLLVTLNRQVCVCECVRACARLRVSHTHTHSLSLSFSLSLSLSLSHKNLGFGGSPILKRMMEMMM